MGIGEVEVCRTDGATVHDCSTSALPTTKLGTCAITTKRSEQHRHRQAVTIKVRGIARAEEQSGIGTEVSGGGQEVGRRKRGTG